jgi:hypothetical protein
MVLGSTAGIFKLTYTSLIRADMYLKKREPSHVKNITPRNAEKAPSKGQAMRPVRRGD